MIPPTSRTRRLWAILIHLYTASGGLLAFWALLAISEGRTKQAFLLLAIVMVIDYSDGSLARSANVAEHLPEIDGSALDKVVDFFSNCVAPLYLLASAGLLPSPAWVWICSVLLVSLFRFSRSYGKRLKSGFFSGLPSPWITLAFYCFYFQPSALATGFAISLLATLSILPTSYVHIARLQRWRLMNAGTLASWWAIYLLITQGLVKPEPYLSLSLLHPAYYLFSSLYLSRRFEGRGS